MSRVSRLSREDVSQPVQELYDREGKRRGKVPNMFRAFAHRPAILQTLVEHLDAVTSEGSVPRLTRELVATLVSRINSCGYCDRSHSRQAAAHGATENQLAQLESFEVGPFDDAQKAALAWARMLTLDARGADDTLFARLREHYDEGEVIELTAMAGLFNYFNRVNDALRVQSTQPGEGL